MKQLYNTALYMRLSRDDETYGDSVSIESQRIILQQYAREHDLHVIGEYIDDGWSGTNFDRPNFQRMMNDVEDGKINCIVTKDLSRFGREHIEMDYYLEILFPEKRVRYIAVTENEDTEKGLSDFVPFKNLFNEWYAKDTSRKVKAAFAAKFEAGQRVCTYAPLGYKKHPDIKNKIIIDEETSWIIEKIFDLAYHGAGAGKITKILIHEHVPTPGWLNYKRYGTFAHIYAGQPEEKQYMWLTSQVKNILKDETYIGNTIHGKQGNISYKNKKRIRKPSSEWSRSENTHQAIISKDVFFQVQQTIDIRRRHMKDATTQIFAGLLRCADCGKCLRFATRSQKSKPYSYFTCISYSEYGKDFCTSHYIRYDVLYDYVLSRIRYWASQANLGEDKILSQLLRNGNNEHAVLRKKRLNELNKAEKRKAELDKLFTKMYEDWAAERISEYNFNMLSAKYQSEQQELDGKIKNITAELKYEQKNTADAEKWISLVKQYTNPSELTAELLNALIEKIVIHEAVKGDDGDREQEIEIFYRFVGKIE